MGIKLSGLVSNMDTDSIVEQMMAAQRTKVTKIENKKTKSTWTQEKWKDLNTKIYKLYTDDLAKLRLHGSYSTNKASSSNEAAVSVTASGSAPTGSHNIAVNQLASGKSITGGVINSKIVDETLTSSSKLVSSLGIAEGTVFTIQTGTDTNPNKIINYTVTSTSSLADFTKACQDAGLNANFDASNKRFYISSKNSGEENTFSIKASNGNLSSEGKAAQKAIYNLFEEGDQTELDKNLPVNIKNQIDTYLNAYTFSTSDTEKKSITESIYNLRANYLKGKIAEEANSGDDPKELTPKEIEDKYKALYEPNDDSKKAILENITEQADAYSLGFSLDTNSTAVSDLKLDKASSNTIDAQDSKIIYNGVLYEQASNTVTINGLTINANQVTDGRKVPDEVKPADLIGVTVSVTKDTQASYDMIKNFVKEYNSILKEMNTLYYAESSRGYDPLTDEEKEAMSEDQIEKWETKIKDSLLRRDNTLGSLISSMKSDMGGSIEVTTKTGDKKNYSLASLGISTSSDYTEKGLLHIYGDADDSTYASETNKLMKALEEDPEAVMQTLTGVAKKLYTTLTDKMKSTSLSSALTLYNDKEMTKQQGNYSKQISTLEVKLEKMEAAYYKKFSAMETALAKLQQSTSALSSLMGTNG